MFYCFFAVAILKHGSMSKYKIKEQSGIIANIYKSI